MWWVASKGLVWFLRAICEYNWVLTLKLIELTANLLSLSVTCWSLHDTISFIVKSKTITAFYSSFEMRSKENKPAQQTLTSQHTKSDKELNYTFSPVKQYFLNTLTIIRCLKVQLRSTTLLSNSVSFWEIFFTKNNRLLMTSDGN